MCERRPGVTYRGCCQVVVVPASKPSHSCCVGDEGSEVEDGGNAVIHHHLEEERNSELPVFCLFCVPFFFFKLSEELFILFFQMTSTSQPTPAFPPYCREGFLLPTVS